MPDHEIALASIRNHNDLPVITAWCECGWHASFSEVTTFVAVADMVNAHHARVLQGIVR
jgi:hypothetical protein